VFFYYDAKLKGKIKIENMASPRRLRRMVRSRSRAMKRRSKKDSYFHIFYYLCGTA